jgi:hypothetical protein
MQLRALGFRRFSFKRRNFYARYIVEMKCCYTGILSHRKLQLLQKKREREMHFNMLRHLYLLLQSLERIKIVAEVWNKVMRK